MADVMASQRILGIDSESGCYIQMVIVHLSTMKSKVFKNFVNQTKVKSVLFWRMIPSCWKSVSPREPSNRIECFCSKQELYGSRTVDQPYIKISHFCPPLHAFWIIRMKYLYKPVVRGLCFK